MAIEIPDDWPGQTWSEDTPLGHLETIDPKAPDGTEPTRWEVASWESTREMSSSSLPGQVRAKTGLSVGTGKAVLLRQPDDYPWKNRLVTDLSGQNAQILLAPQNRTEIPTGQFRAAEISGDVTTRGVQVDLDERQISGKDQKPGVVDWEWPPFVTQDEINSLEKDPIWWIAELAAQMGYSSGPSPVPGQSGYNPILDVPLQGSLVARYPRNVRFSTTDTYSWGASEGSVGLTTQNDLSITVTYQVEAAVPQKYVITMDLNDGWGSFEWDDVSTAGRLGVEVLVDLAGTEGSLNIYSTGSNGVANTSTLTDFDLTRNPDAPNRVQVEVTLTPVGDTGYNSASVRLQRELAEWTTPSVHSMTNQISQVNDHNGEMGLSHSGGGVGFLAHFSVVDTVTTTQANIDALLTTTGGSQGRIYLEPLVGTIVSPWLDPDISVWTTMQEIVEAWQAALITDVYGDLKVLNRFTLSGNNDLQQERIIDVGLKFEDVPWEMNYADQADRLTVRYRPVNTQIAEPNATKLSMIYEFQDIIIVYPGSNDVFFTLEYLYPTDLKLLTFVRKDADNNISHVWDAFRYNNGSGAHIEAPEDIGLRIEQVSSSTWKVVIENFTAQPFHMVDSTGTAYLKIRSSYWYDQTRESVLERGLSSSEAQNALEVDLKHYVQNEEDANALADYLWGRVNQRSWQARTVRMVPDYRLDLGDVLEIVHTRTGVRSNALVSKVAWAGTPGEVRQQVDLLLIPPTWEDFDEAWANALPSSTWNTFDALWDDYTWNDFDRTPIATTVAQIEEGM